MDTGADAGAKVRRSGDARSSIDRRKARRLAIGASTEICDESVARSAHAEFAETLVCHYWLAQQRMALKTARRLEPFDTTPWFVTIDPVGRVLRCPPRCWPSQQRNRDERRFRRCASRHSSWRRREFSGRFSRDKRRRPVRREGSRRNRSASNVCRAVRAPASTRPRPYPWSR